MNIQEIIDSTFVLDDKTYIANQILMAVILEISNDLSRLSEHREDLPTFNSFNLAIGNLMGLSSTLLKNPQDSTLFTAELLSNIASVIDTINFFNNRLNDQQAQDNNSIVAQADLVHNNDTEATSWTDFLNPFFCCTTVANVVNPAYIAYTTDNVNNQDHFVGGGPSSAFSKYS